MGSWDTGHSKISMVIAVGLYVFALAHVQSSCLPMMASLEKYYIE